MKTKNELFELLAQSTLKGDKVFFHWSGHTNELEITHYRAGWKMHKETDTLNLRETCQVYLTSDEGIQEAYWFLYNRISK